MMSNNAAIRLMGGYIKSYVDDYRHDPEKLRKLLKSDILVTLMIDDDYIDYIVRISQETKKVKRRVTA